MYSLSRKRKEIGNYCRYFFIRFSRQETQMITGNVSLQYADVGAAKIETDQYLL